jgi:hypothetical protein
MSNKKKHSYQELQKPFHNIFKSVFSVLLMLSITFFWVPASANTDTRIFPQWVSFIPQNHGTPYEGVFRLTTSESITLNTCSVNNQDINCSKFETAKGYKVIKDNPINFIINDWSLNSTKGYITFNNNGGDPCIFNISKLPPNKKSYKYEISHHGACGFNWVDGPGTPTVYLPLNY